ncbi:MAG TPA: chalcone isomerase family protein [Thermoanaerobaculia bacterium]|nr:chalcone isomerase family protein [Thermoanaerobaculia bacterium]
MRWRAMTVAPVVFALAVFSPAGEVAGVTMAETATVEGRTLHLNGMGLRTKVIVKVYVAGLYLESPSKDAAVIVSSDQVKSIRLSLLRDVAGAKITEAIVEGFERNSKAQLAALQPRLEKLRAMIPDVVKGDQIVLTYLPGKGTMVQARGAEKGFIDGKDFADALLSVWLGANPVQSDLKKALLGG